MVGRNWTAGGIGILVTIGWIMSSTLPGWSKEKGAVKMGRTFQNPILTGFHPDPSICRKGDDFYLVNSTFEMFPGLPIYHSKDLVHWELIGNALTRDSQLPLKGATDTGGLYAPTIRYWKGTFYLTCDNISGGGNFIVTAKDPAGPWSEPMWMNDFSMDGSMFFDDDGKCYYTGHAGGEKGGIQQAEFDPATGKLTTVMKVIYNDLTEVWNEGPHLYKIKGFYYLMLAEGGTGDRHMEVIGRAKSPWGPFDPCPQNPILTERDEPQSPIQCTGHADLIEAPDKSWWMVFLGVRPKNGVSVLGRETFLAPVVWTKDGWPIVNGDHHVSLEMPAPKLKPFPFPAHPARTLFTGDKLGPEWLHIRNTDQANYSLLARPGFLRIMTAKGSLDQKSEEPAFVGQRQPAFRLSARTEMEFNPTQDGEEAGLCVRANDDNHYEIALGWFDGKREIFVRNHVRGESYLVAQEPFTSDKVQLEISGTESQYQFAYSLDGKVWKTLAASPSADLSRERAGGFTGTAIGLYASSNGKDSKNYADFAWFEMLPGVVPEQVAVSARPTPTPLPASDTWRVDAGGDSFTDHTGALWSQDGGSIGGDTVGTGRPIAAKEDRQLYETERWGADFSYVFRVLPGKYKVRLLFAETYVKGPGQRVFDILINDKKVLADFDIFKEAGGMDEGIEKSFGDVHPDADGLVRVRFVSSVQNAKVCAVEVVRQRQ